ncbi:hypothetical protein PSAC2689_30352 [Paraburkholderia sacchari]
MSSGTCDPNCTVSVDGYGSLYALCMKGRARGDRHAWSSGASGHEAKLDPRCQMAELDAFRSFRTKRPRSSEKRACGPAVPYASAPGINP